MRLWDQHWTVKDEPYGGYDCMAPAFVVTIPGLGHGQYTVSFEHWNEETKAQSEAFGRFVSAAPDLARALLDICVPNEPCPYCGSLTPDCQPKCPVDAALRKAGVR